MSVRTVLVPLDGSEMSRQIDHVVRTFISPNDVKLVLLWTWCPPSLTPEIPPENGNIQSKPRREPRDLQLQSVGEQHKDSVHRDEIRGMLEEELFAEVNRLRSAGYAVTGEVQFGELVQQIIEYVNEKHVDLVAMVTNSLEESGNPKFGGITERVARGISVPVLLMRTNVH